MFNYNGTIIDFHMHPIVNPKSNICRHKDLDVAAMLADLSRINIGQFAGSVIWNTDGTDFAPIREMNDAAIALHKQYPDKYIPGIHIHPNFVKESCEELKRCSDMGVRLIGELVPYLMGWGNRDASSESLEILRYAMELGMVLSIHTGTNDDRLDVLAAELPQMPIVLAHPGEQESYMRHLERMEKYPNVYLDISGTGLFRYAMLPYGVKRVGAERFLFGTDYPVCDPAMQIAAVLYADITDAEKEAIFCGNAKRLLNV